MKKISLVLGLLAIWAAALAQGIGSAKDLQDFIEAYNKGESVLQWSDADSVVVLTSDIDLSKTKKLPQVASFAGHFDGKGFRLRGWKASAGLFKEIARTGIVENLTIDKSCVLKCTSKGDEFKVGFIADFNNGVVRYCVNEGSVSHNCSYALGPIHVGGLVGYNKYVMLGCRNLGSVSSDTSGEPKEAVFLSIGGICGGGTGKNNTVSSVVRSENEGAVKAVTNLVALYIGGIIGYSARTQLKYCVNRGEVLADMREAEDGGTAGLSKVGGIAGVTKNNILHCENHGAVTGKGACGAYVGGICGQPHDAMVVADCVNYGTVTTAGEQPSHTGGIAGNISRQAHIRGCINYGKIVFAGVSSRARSTSAGIVGNIHVPKTQTSAAFVSGCINYGEIVSSAGGNKFDSNNRNAIHTAGVVGCAESRPGLPGCVKDCANYGKISAASGRKGSIIASAVSVKTGGSAPTDWAVALDEVPAGGNVTGKVLTSSGEPREGIVVSDGIQCVKTGADGSFSMNSDLETCRFISLSLPADAVIPLRNGMPCLAMRVPIHSKAVRADFVLDRREPAKDYTVLMIADPQVRPFGWDNSMETWHTRVAPDAEAFRASCKGDVYCINLGDLVYNEMTAWDDYLDGAAIIKCPTFNVIGNHDYDQYNLFETRLGNICYESYVGPSNYSFDLGDIHFIAMNDILYDRATSADKYHYGLDDETLAWLKADLAFVPKDKIIVTCTHNNPFKTPNKSPHGSHNVYSLNYSEYLALLSSYRKVYAWNGHNHENFYYNYAGKDTKHGAPNIQCISVARATGALRFNREIAAKGEPQGYMVMEVRGDSLSWYYKGVGTGKETQMRGYSPVRTGDGTVKVNIWNWSEGWSTPAWYENGVKVADMSFTPGVDPAYNDLFSTIENKTTRKYCTPSKEAILFSVTPSPGVSSGEIRVSDLFGNVYTETVSW